MMESKELPDVKTSAQSVLQRMRNRGDQMKVDPKQ